MSWLVLFLESCLRHVLFWKVVQTCFKSVLFWHFSNVLFLLSTWLFMFWLVSLFDCSSVLILKAWNVLSPVPICPCLLVIVFEVFPWIMTSPSFDWLSSYWEMQVFIWPSWIIEWLMARTLIGSLITRSIQIIVICFLYLLHAQF